VTARGVALRGGTLCAARALAAHISSRLLAVLHSRRLSCCTLHTAHAGVTRAIEQHRKTRSSGSKTVAYRFLMRTACSRQRGNKASARHQQTAASRR